ncbi:MAG: AgmX/PglI C-terminal domain-containing protein [Deltaproteobacteria bacterium]|nr:AgmX/PglI C-terminal domain-containing protein [Deltaproteobacteria bacterium]
MSRRISFKIYYADELISEETFTENSIKIGRLPSVNLKLEDPTVSRIHAQIEATSDGYYIRDMGSSAGTIVNGKKVDKIALKNGDEILLGKTKLVVYFEQNRVSPPIMSVDEVGPESHRQSPTSSGKKELESKPKKKEEPQIVAKKREDDIEGEEQDPYGNKAIEIKFLWYQEMVDVKYFMYPQKVTIGSTSRCDFYIIPDEITIPEYPVIRTINKEYRLTFPKNVEGEVYIGESSKSFKDLIDEKRAVPDPSIPDSYVYTLPPNSITRMYINNAVLQFRFTPPPKKLPLGLGTNIDYNYLNALIVALFFMVTSLVSMYLFPYDMKAETEQAVKNPNKFVNFIMTPAKKIDEDKELKKLKEMPKQGESGAKAANKEGKMGKKDAPEVFKRAAVKAIKPDDREIVQKVGVLKMFGKSGGMFAGGSTLFGGKGLGGDLQNAIGGLFGSQIGDARGSGGLGLRGVGPGGGGSSLDSIGIGTVGTRGRGAGQGGYGYGVGSIGGKKEHDIGISGGTPMVLGSLDKELIRRVIRAHANEIRYCYELELAKNPGLWGKVSVNFVISPTGSVQSAKVKETTLNNQNVENCIISKVKGWKFPEPKGGGIVIVTYPFILKRTD